MPRYVRPSGGSYGLQDGSSYANAWNGLANVNWSTVLAEGDRTLYICGNHSEATWGSPSASGTSGNHIVVRGDAVEEAGSVTLANASWSLNRDYFTIKNFTFDPGNNNAFFISGARTDIIIDNIVSNNVRRFVAFATATGSSFTNITVQNCTVNQNVGNDLDNFIYLQSATASYDIILDNITIAGNTINGCDTSNAILFYSSSSAAPNLKISDVLIENNTFIDNKLICIRISGDWYTITSITPGTTTTLTTGAAHGYVSGNSIYIHNVDAISGVGIPTGTYTCTTGTTGSTIVITHNSVGTTFSTSYTYKGYICSPYFNRFIIRNNTFTNSGDSAEVTGGCIQFSTVTNSALGESAIYNNYMDTLYGDAGGMVIFNCKYLEVYNNYIYNCNAVTGGKDGGGIDIDIANEDINVYNNFVDTCNGVPAASSTEGSGFGVLVLSNKNVNIYNNIFKNCKHGVVIYSVATSHDNINIYNNTILDTEYKGIFEKLCVDGDTSNGDVINIYNNIVVNAGDYAFYRTTTPADIIYSGNNILYNSTTGTYFQAQSNMNTASDINADPVLTEEYLPDLGSPCKDAGVAIINNTDVYGRINYGNHIGAAWPVSTLDRVPTPIEIQNQLDSLSSADYINVLDYGIVNDGVTEVTTAMQTFFDGLSGGEVILFPPGSYYHNEVTITSKNNLTLIGYGATLLGDVSFGGAFSGFTLKFVTCNNLLIKGFRLDRKNSLDAATKYQSGIHLFGCDTVTITHVEGYDVKAVCSTTDSLGTGAGTYCRNITVTNCSIENRTTWPWSGATAKDEPWYLFLCNYVNGSKCINNYNYGGQLTFVNTSTDAIVSNNYSYLSNDSDIYFAKGAERFTCTGNSIYYAGKDSIKAINDATPGTGNPIEGTISNNICKGAGFVATSSPHSILIDNAAYITVSGNACYPAPEGDRGTSVAGYGIGCKSSHHINIIGNNIYNEDPQSGAAGYDSGITCDTDDAALDSINIIGNVIHGDYRYPSIRLLATTNDIIDINISDNIIEGEDATDAGAAGQAGISVQTDANRKASRINIDNNLIKECYTGGIRLGANDTGGVLEDIYITNNKFYDFNSATGEPFYLLGTGTYTRVIVDGNISDDTIGTAGFTDFFQLQAGASTGLTIKPNNFAEGVLIESKRIIDGTTVTSPHTINAWDTHMTFVQPTTATAAGTINLPAAKAGMEIIVRNENTTYTFIVDPSGTDTIDGSTANKTLGVATSTPVLYHIRAIFDGAWVLWISNGSIT